MASQVRQAPGPERRYVRFIRRDKQSSHAWLLGAALRGQNADSADPEGDDDAKDEAMEE